MIGGLAALLLCQLAGEMLARALHLPIPGPVLGMALLLAALLARRAIPEPLERTANGLLANLGLLFVPAGVGVVMHLDVLASDAAPIGLAILGGTLVAIGVTGLVAARLLQASSR
jgi:holin-like protein